MSWDDTVGNMETLDRWRAEIGLGYAHETAAQGLHTITRRPLARHPDAVIPRGRIGGLDKPKGWTRGPKDVSVILPLADTP